MIYNLARSTTSPAYEFVGGTSEPTNPNNKTIWVNTSVAITGHIFANDYPVNPYEGLLYIKTDAELGSGLNVDNQYKIFVYPLCAKQYINGKWKSVYVRDYSSNSYTEWWNGDLLVENIAGAINEYKYNYDGTYISAGKIIMEHPGPGYAVSTNVRTDKLVDYTGWNTLRITVTVFSTTFGIEVRVEPYVHSKTDETMVSTSSVITAYSADEGNTVTLDLNVSNLNDLYYVGLELGTVSGNYGTATVRIDEIKII